MPNDVREKSCFASAKEYEEIEQSIKKHCKEKNHHYREVTRYGGWSGHPFRLNPTTQRSYFICLDCGYRETLTDLRARLEKTDGH